MVFHAGEPRGSRSPQRVRPVQRISPPHEAAETGEGDRALHARLLRRDLSAPSDLVQAHLEPLVRWLRARYPRADDDLLQDVAVDLLLSLAERPEQYDPDRAPLQRYLRMAARRDVQNALRGERRRSRLLVRVQHVELAGPTGKRPVESAEDPAEMVARSEPLSPRTLALVRSAFDDAEWEIVQLMLDGERRTGPYAALLGLAERPPQEQARQVKRVKDRLLKRLQRLAPQVRRDG